MKFKAIDINGNTVIGDLFTRNGLFYIRDKNGNIVQVVYESIKPLTN